MGESDDNACRYVIRHKDRVKNAVVFIKIP